MFLGSKNKFLSSCLTFVTQEEDLKLSVQCNFSSYRLHEAGIEIYNRLTLMEAPDSILLRSWVQISFRKIGHTHIFWFFQSFDVNIEMITRNRPQPHPFTSFAIHYSQLSHQSKLYPYVGYLTTMAVSIQFRMIGRLMHMGQLVESGLPGETQALGRSQPLCHFVSHKSHITGPGVEHGSPLWSTLYCPGAW
jgi:hypothetical protein